jgi:hypothetical protein
MRSTPSNINSRGAGRSDPTVLNDEASKLIVS